MAIERIGGAPAPSTDSPKPTKPAATPARSFDAEMKRIASHAESVETLKNGAKLYHLAGGREIEQVPGKSPYVTKKGEWPPPKTSSAPTTPATTTPAAPAPAPTTTTSPSTTTPSTTTPSTKK